MQDYAFTIKYTTADKAKCVPSDYDEVFKRWSNYKVVIQAKYYEPDSKGVCHVHGIVTMHKHMLYKRLGQPGMHMYMKPITDRDGWIRYIRKHQKPVRVIPVYTISTLTRDETDTQSPSEEPEEIFSPEHDLPKLKGRILK